MRVPPHAARPTARAGSSRSARSHEPTRRYAATATAAPGAARARPVTVGPAAVELVATARRGLLEADLLTAPAERYAAAHLAALRAAAAVLAAKARPDTAPRTRRPTSAWVLVTQVAPELAEWAAFFAAGARKRAAAEAGLTGAVTAREADDLVRDAETFLAVVETTLGLPHQPILAPASG